MRTKSKYAVSVYKGLPYWIWIAFLILATSWGSFVTQDKLDWWWNLSGILALIYILLYLRWWEQRRILAAVDD